MDRLDSLLLPPGSPGVSPQRKYYCRNPANLQYFGMLARILAANGNSYINRLRRMDTLLFIVSHTDKDLRECRRDDIDEIVACAHAVFDSPKTKRCFFRSMKQTWRQLFPERDEHERVDDTIVPYVVRHVSCHVDRSQDRLRDDKLTVEEFLRIVNFFSADLQTQAYITLALESLGRPQELCYRTIGDVELHDGYAKVWVSSHGKEGTRYLQCVDSYPYLIRWFELHPCKTDKSAPLFFSGGDPHRQMTPHVINKRLRRACRVLRIDKQVTGYSLKRVGVTFRRLRGESDVEIQHAAGWTSTQQLKTYDLSNADDAFQRKLSRRGLAGSQQADADQALKTRPCVCGGMIGFADAICRRCKRPTNPRNELRRDEETKEQDTKARQLLTAALEEPRLAKILEEVLRSSRQRDDRDEGTATPPAVKKP